ncbi:hypothetical protein IAR50_006225 [Cryptococcus sp. DSM 104548]
MPGHLSIPAAPLLASSARKTHGNINQKAQFSLAKAEPVKTLRLTKQKPADTSSNILDIKDNKFHTTVAPLIGEAKGEDNKGKDNFVRGWHQITGSRAKATSKKSLASVSDSTSSFSHVTSSGSSGHTADDPFFGLRTPHLALDGRKKTVIVADVSDMILGPEADILHPNDDDDWPTLNVSCPKEGGVRFLHEETQGQKSQPVGAETKEEADGGLGEQSVDESGEDTEDDYDHDEVLDPGLLEELIGKEEEEIEEAVKDFMTKANTQYTLVSLKHYDQMTETYKANRPRSLIKKNMFSVCTYISLLHATPCL